MLLLCFLLVAIFLLNLHASFWNFARLNLSVNAIPAGYQGDQVEAKLKLTEPNCYSDKFNGVLTISEYKSQDSISIDCLDLTEIQLPILLSKRGVHHLPRITLSSLFPFGLYKCWTHIDFDRQLLVYPLPIPTELSLLSLNQAENDSQGGKSNY